MDASRLRRRSLPRLKKSEMFGAVILGGVILVLNVIRMLSH